MGTLVLWTEMGPLHNGIPKPVWARSHLRCCGISIKIQLISLITMMPVSANLWSYLHVSLTFSSMVLLGLLLGWLQIFLLTIWEKPLTQWSWWWIILRWRPVNLWKFFLVQISRQVLWSWGNQVSTKPMKQGKARSFFVLVQRLKWPRVAVNGLLSLSSLIWSIKPRFTSTSFAWCKKNGSKGLQLYVMNQTVKGFVLWLRSAEMLRLTLFWTTSLRWRKCKPILDSICWRSKVVFQRFFLFAKF